MRELSRVATAGTDAAWRDRALGKNLRQIEELVSGHARGDSPDDPKDPSLQPTMRKLQMSPDVAARFRQAEMVLAEEHGGRRSSWMATRCCARMRRRLKRSRPTWDRDWTMRSCARKRAMRWWASGGSRTSRGPRSRKRCLTWDTTLRSRN
ncbi:MAG: hypothetical protein M4D80_00330 [Myxococcota bacterium]|nr:hypothetical protein [Myxococcota bacterium]